MSVCHIVIGKAAEIGRAKSSLGSEELCTPYSKLFAAKWFRAKRFDNENWQFCYKCFGLINGFGSAKIAIYIHVVLSHHSACIAIGSGVGNRLTHLWPQARYFRSHKTRGREPFVQEGGLVVKQNARRCRHIGHVCDGVMPFQILAATNSYTSLTPNFVL
jgi:hypothetical protein